MDASFAPGAPRWPALLGLAVVVLLVHALLLFGLPTFGRVGHLSGEPGEQPPSRPTGEPGAVPTPSPPEASVPAVLHSQVRWITPPETPTETPLVAPERRTPADAATPVTAHEETLPSITTDHNDPGVDTVADTGPDDTATGPVPGFVPTQASVTATESTATPPPPTDSSAAAPLSASTSPATVQDANSGTGGDSVALAPARTVLDTDLSYDVEGLIKGLPFHARGALLWRQRGDRYEARLEISAFLIGSRVQTSTGRIGPHGLEPERFSDKSRSEKAAHFDHSAARIRFSNNAPEVPLLGGAQDRLSVFMQLAALFEARPQAYPRGSVIEMQVAGTGGADRWRFEVESGPEPLNLPAGDISAIHLYRPPRLEYDNALEVWLAPQLHHLPVRIRITQKNGDVADQQLNFVPKTDLAR